MKIPFTVFLLVCFQSGFAQVSLSGARSTGMGNANVAFTDVNSLFGNQAGLVGLKNLGLIVAAERRFLMAELDVVAAGVAIPGKTGVFGLTFQNFGFPEFRQQKIGLAYARRLFKNLSVGAQFDFLQTKIPEYGSKGLFTFEAGALVDLTKKITIGAHVFSPAQVGFSDEDKLPAILNLGLSYRPSGVVTLALSFEKDIDFPLRLNAGFEYQIMEALYIRSGFSTEPASFQIGIGLKLGNGVSVDAASSYHQTLGLSPAASVIYSKPQKK